MNLKQHLQQAAERLRNRPDFSSPPEGTQRAKAIELAASTLPLVLFLEWLERCPEARELICTDGLGWGFSGVVKDANAEGDRVSIRTPRSPFAATLGDFRVRLGEGYVNCRLVDVVGDMLKVTVEGQPAGHITAVPLGNVSPVDLNRVKAAVALMPGSKTELFFDPEEQPGPEQSSEAQGAALPPPEVPPDNPKLAGLLKEFEAATDPTGSAFDPKTD